MVDDPTFHHTSRRGTARPMWVTGHTFDPAARTVDFSAVPNFGFGRLRQVFHVRTQTLLYARPAEADYGGLIEVDGEPVLRVPTVGKVLKVRHTCAGMVASDEIAVAYDHPSGD